MDRCGITAGYANYLFTQHQTDVVEKGGVASTLAVYASLEALLSPSRSDLHICGVVGAKRTDNGPSSARASTRCVVCGEKRGLAAFFLVLEWDRIR